jgi:hypothetical protein
LDIFGEDKRVAIRVVENVPTGALRAAFVVGVPVNVTVELASVAVNPELFGVPLISTKLNPSSKGPHVYRILLPIFGYGGALENTVADGMDTPACNDKAFELPDKSMTNLSGSTRIFTSTVTILLVSTDPRPMILYALAIL